MAKKKKETAVETPKVTVSVNKLNVRKAPSMTADIVKVVNLNDKLELKEDCGEWLKVKGGYVRAEFVVM